MNARLRLKLIHSQQAVRKPAPPPPPALPPLRLLGEGLDAIIQHTRRPQEGWLGWLLRGTNDPQLPNQPEPKQRLDRYLVALGLHPLPDHDLADRRAMLGELIKQQWQRGRFPRILKGCLLIAASRHARRKSA